ncbi:MAG: carbohydrate kinase family protein [Christensenellaceae bacterium]|jgi:sugar/nucleoside kinase (ribokinase family)|nr:carbohydrate kinase family protein [Christensenellaceae bacterium]
MNKFLAGIGKCNIDLIFSTLPKLPSEGDEIYADNFDICLGGGALGSLINLARLGLPVKAFTYLGEDLFSNFATKQLQHFGIEYHNLAGTTQFAGVVTVALATKRDRTFVSWRGENHYSSKAEEDLLLKCSGAHAVIMQCGAYYDAYSQLKRQGTKLFLDLGFDSDMSIKKYAKELALADVYFPNASEALKITNLSTLGDAGTKLSELVERVVVTCASDGAQVFENGTSFHLPPPSGTKFVDATGAGDAFLAGYAYGDFMGYSTYKCVAAGNIMGARCVTQIGCLTSSTTASELEQLLMQYEL